jgi:ATP-dependent Clp protease protease subunit
MIYLGNDDTDGMINSRVAEKFIKSLLLFDDENITIIINSSGGCVTSGMAIYDAIKMYPGRVTALVLGEASSIAAAILQAADVRVITPNAEILIHQGTAAAAEDHVKNVIRMAKELERDMVKYESILLGRIQEKRPDFTLIKLRNMLDFDTRLNAEESLNLGLVDYIKS